ncbi:hypothetical protein AGMMS49965_23540 [Bacteroidia bacterium]|nr:hypothetical protein AGMMS49965_23540 [Bacteroidia bacterium]
MAFVGSLSKTNAEIEAEIRASKDAFLREWVMKTPEEKAAWIKKRDETNRFVDAGLRIIIGVFGTAFVLFIIYFLLTI